MKHLAVAMVTSALMLLPMAGCIVSTRDGDKGGKDVDITTPLGGMSVKTDSNAVQKKLGLPLYPGAVPDTHKNDRNENSADVDMSFGAFHLRVLAMGFTTTDSPDKVRDYYRKALGQYSDVIECQHKQTVGKPTRTGLGLTCADDNHVQAREIDKDEAKETELKAGSPSRQHIVSFEAHGGGTRFGLVSLELPRGDDKGA